MELETEGIDFLQQAASSSHLRPARGAHLTSWSHLCQGQLSTQPFVHHAGKRWVVLSHSQKNGNDGRKTRARLVTKWHLVWSKRNPGTLSRSQLSPAELSPSSPNRFRASLPAAHPPPRAPHNPSGSRGPVRGAPTPAASASELPAAPQPPSLHSPASSLPPQRQRGELGVTGLWPPGAHRTSWVPSESRRGAAGRTGSDPRWHQRLPSPYKRARAHVAAPPKSSSPEKVRRSASPRGQGVHSPPKGSCCRAEAWARARLATSHLRPPRARAPESPQPLTWPWSGATAEDQGVALVLAGARLPTPSPGPSTAPPLAEAALLRGASAAGGWRLSGRRAGRALSSPGRSEAAAAEARGGFLRCLPLPLPQNLRGRDPSISSPALSLGVLQPPRPRVCCRAPLPSGVVGARCLTRPS